VRGQICCKELDDPIKLSRCGPCGRQLTANSRTNTNPMQCQGGSPFPSRLFEQHRARTGRNRQDRRIVR
jgi:hypothetical protein